MVALTEPRLLPLTAGVLGDWGSGKSSLMRIVRVELEAEGTTDALGRYSCPRLANPVCGLLGEEIGEPERPQAVLLAEMDGQGVAEQLALPA